MLENVMVKSGFRRISRELALSLLYQHETSGVTPEESVHLFELNFDPKFDEEVALNISAEEFAQAWPLAKELFLGTVSHLDELDCAIKKVSLNWSLGRMTRVDRSLIRMAYFEMRYRKDIPVRASLNEALEISKNFGDEDSTAFINGILDRLLNDMAAE